MFESKSSWKTKLLRDLQEKYSNLDEREVSTLLDEHWHFCKKNAAIQFAAFFTLPFFGLSTRWIPKTFEHNIEIFRLQRMLTVLIVYGTTHLLLQTVLYFILPAIGKLETKDLSRIDSSLACEDFLRSVNKDEKNVYDVQWKRFYLSFLGLVFGVPLLISRWSREKLLNQSLPIGLLMLFMHVPQLTFMSIKQISMRSSWRNRLLISVHHHPDVAVVDAYPGIAA